MKNTIQQLSVLDHSVVEEPPRKRRKRQGLAIGSPLPPAAISSAAPSAVIPADIAAPPRCAEGAQRNVFAVPTLFIQKMKDLTEAGLKVYVALCSLADGEGQVTDHSVADICRAAGLRERAVQAAVAKLQRKRLINRSRTDGKRNHYRIFHLA